MSTKRFRIPQVSDGLDTLTYTSIFGLPEVGETRETGETGESGESGEMGVQKKPLFRGATGQRVLIFTG